MSIMGGNVRFGGMPEQPFDSQWVRADTVQAGCESVPVGYNKDKSGSSLFASEYLQRDTMWYGGSPVRQKQESAREIMRFLSQILAFARKAGSKCADLLPASRCLCGHRKNYSWCNRPYMLKFLKSLLGDTYEKLWINWKEHWQHRIFLWIFAALFSTGR